MALPRDGHRRSIAYLLIALLAFLVIALLAMVVFGVITVGEVKEFDRVPGSAGGAGNGGHRLLLHQKAYLTAARANRPHRRKGGLWWQIMTAVSYLSRPTCAISTS